MKTITCNDFSEPLLAWARDQFTEEIRSNFQRSGQYDGPRAKEHLRVLRRQSPEVLAILARVLPLEVFWETPDALKRRGMLTPEERKAVEKLRSDYNAECGRNLEQNIERLRRGRNPEVKSLFNLAVRDGNQIHQQVAEERNLSPATAGPGEWGFIGQKDWGRFVISINLGRSMSFGYRIGPYNEMGETIRFHDHYLMVLGVGAGDWLIENKDEFPRKFLKAVDFAVWHADEYDKIANHICGES